MTETMLWRLQQVTVTGRSGARLASVSLTIRSGITAVLGNSGAGKSTLLNLLVSFEHASNGQLVCEVAAAAREPAYYWVPQDFGMWPFLTAAEHLAVARGRVDAAADRALLEGFGLAAKLEVRPSQLSQGEQARLAVARALASGAKVLVMDEPLINVSGAQARACWQVIRDYLRDCDGSLIFSTHSPALVLRHAADVICLESGQALYAGSAATLYSQPASPALAACLGETNWFDPPAQQRWLGRALDSPNVRPEQLELVPTDDPTAPSVVQSCHAGSVSETLLRHAASESTRWFWHRADAALRIGQHVVLRLLALCLVMLLTACGGEQLPELPVVAVNFWRLPPAGPMTPAPRSIGIGLNDDVAVLDNAGRVLIYNADGNLLRSWSMPETAVGKPEGVAILHDNRVVVCDTHYHRVLIFDRQGQVVREFGSEGREPGQFIYPVAVTEDGDGDLYIGEYGSNDRIQKFSSDGELLLAFGSFGVGPGQFQRPSGIVWHDGRLYVSDAFNNRVQVFTDEGQYLCCLPDSGDLGLYFPYDIAIGPQEHIYLVEYGACRISCIDLNGVLLGRYGLPGTEVGCFRTPWGLGVDSQGRLRVADTGNRRIVELLL